MISSLLVANHGEMQPEYSDPEDSLHEDTLGHDTKPSSPFPTEKEGPTLNPLWSNPQAGTLYERRDSPGKGHGLFATKPIERGTCVIAEAPLLRLGPMYYSEPDVENAFEQLPLASQRSFLSLASCHNSSPCTWFDGTFSEPQSAAAANGRSVYTIYQTNCVDISGHNGPDSAIFETISRINHSCLPNCFFAWNSNLQKETVYAIRDIVEGEELFVAYCDLVQGKAERKADLIGYGFTCDCMACQEESLVVRIV